MFWDADFSAILRCSSKATVPAAPSCNGTRRMRTRPFPSPAAFQSPFGGIACSCLPGLYGSLFLLSAVPPGDGANSARTVCRAKGRRRLSLHRLFQMDKEKRRDSSQLILTLTSDLQDRMKSLVALLND